MPLPTTRGAAAPVAPPFLHYCVNQTKEIGADNHFVKPCCCSVKYIADAESQITGHNNNI